jgi:hypothetical protein
MKDKCSADHRNGWCRADKVAEGVVIMQQSSPKKNFLSRIGAGWIFVLCLAIFVPPAYARQPETIPVAWPDVPPPLLIAMADPPDFLAPAPTCDKELGEKEKAGAVTPFIGTRQVLTLLPTPERPGIATSDGVPLERPEVTAGVDVDLGRVEFNLGYTLPSTQVDEFVRPFGVDLEPGSDSKCISLGVKVPF